MTKILPFDVFTTIHTTIKFNLRHFKAILSTSNHKMVQLYHQRILMGLNGLKIDFFVFFFFSEIRRLHHIIAHPYTPHPLCFAKFMRGRPCPRPVAVNDVRTTLPRLSAHTTPTRISPNGTQIHRADGCLSMWTTATPNTNTNGGGLVRAQKFRHNTTHQHPQRYTLPTPNDEPSP